MNIRQTSLMAFGEVKGNLGERQQQVYKLFLDHPTLYDQEISYHLSLPINQITPRRNELEKKGLIECVGTIESRFTHKMVRVYKKCHQQER